MFIKRSEDERLRGHGDRCRSKTECPPNPNGASNEATVHKARRQNKNNQKTIKYSRGAAEMLGSGHTMEQDKLATKEGRTQA